MDPSPVNGAQVPRIAINKTPTTNNTTPVSLQNDITINPNHNIIPTTQDDNVNHTDDIANTPIENNSTKSLILLHHKEDADYVMTDLCLTRQELNDEDMNICKYGATNCMVLKSKVRTCGTLCTELSKNVFIPTPGILKQYKYPIIDTTLLKCAVPSCKALVTKKGECSIMHVGNMQCL
jgi:hypothetical protein